MTTTTETQDTSHWPSTILPHHRAKLESSGLTAETAIAAGIRSETDKIRLAHLLDYKRWGKEWGSALVIPLYGHANIARWPRVADGKRESW